MGIRGRVKGGEKWGRVEGGNGKKGKVLRMGREVRGGEGLREDKKNG